MKPHKTYSALSQDEDGKLNSDTLSPNETPQHHRWLQRSIFLLMGGVAALVCLAIGYLAHPSPSCSSSSTSSSSINHHQHDHQYSAHKSTTTLHCGDSPVTARSRNCTFDLLTNNWMPAYCADPATDAEYRAWVLDPARLLGPFAYYRDEAAQHRVESEEQLAGLVGQHVYTTAENHLGHCAFLARRMHRLVTGEVKAVAHNTFAHTMHCTRAILRSFEEKGGEEVEREGAVGVGTRRLERRVAVAGGMERMIQSTFDVGIVNCTVGEGVFGGGVL